MIDWNRVKTLRDEVGAEDFDEVVELFLDEVEEVIGRLRSTPDLSSLEGDLHFLKGSAMGLGFLDFSEACQAGETLSASGRSEEVDLPTILSAYDASKIQFQTELPTALST